MFARVGNTDAASCNVFSNFYNTHTHRDPSPLFYSMNKINEQLSRDGKSSCDLSVRVYREMNMHLDVYLLLSIVSVLD